MLTKIIPTWPFVVGALVVGLGAGAYADHKIMQGRIDKMVIAHAETLRVREVQRVKDEVAAREREQEWVLRVNESEQRRINETYTIRTDADTLIARLRKQAAAKPAGTSQMPGATPSCESAVGGELPDRSREDFVRLAQRATEIQLALGACYRAYDTVALPTQ